METFDVLNEWGEFTGEIATRQECHTSGLWHRAVYAFIINDKNEVLLQKRSSTKKTWPNMWDVTLGGHVLAGEFGRESLIREAKEELDIDINDADIKYLVGSTSIDTHKDIINKHFNECYVITKNINVSELRLQEEEVSEVRFFTIEEVREMIHDDYKNITKKIGPWNFLEVILNKYYNSVESK